MFGVFLYGAGGTPAGVGVVVAEKDEQQQKGEHNHDDKQYIGNAAAKVVAPAFGRVGRSHIV